MPLASPTERRRRLRDILGGSRVVSPGSVFDGSSARLARAAGYEVGLMGGSIASHAVLSAPDIMLITLSELTEQVRRACRASDLPLIVDADHGYGNALAVQRTVQEIESAGAAALSIEDSDLPRRFGKPEGVISREEFAGKLRAAVAARIDPSLVIVGRVEAMPYGGLEEVLARVQICNEAGVDLVFARGVRGIEDVQAIGAASKLPLMVNAVTLPEDQLVANKVRVVTQGHMAYMVMLRALYDAQKFIHDGGDPADLADRALTPEMQRLVLGADDYDRYTKEFLEG